MVAVKRSKTPTKKPKPKPKQKPAPKDAPKDAPKQKPAPKLDAPLPTSAAELLAALRQHTAVELRDGTPTIHDPSKVPVSLLKLTAAESSNVAKLLRQEAMPQLPAGGMVEPGAGAPAPASWGLPPTPLSEGTALLQGVVQAAVHGHVAELDTDKLRSLLTEWQTRLDLGQVGVGAHALTRIARGSQVIEQIEAQMEAEFMTLEPEQKLAYLNYLQKDVLANKRLLDARAQQPSLSSPENLAGSLMGKTVETGRLSGLPAEARKRLHTMLSKVKANAIDVAAEQVSQAD